MGVRKCTVEVNVKRRLCRSRDTGRGMEEGSRELRVREKRGMEEKKRVESSGWAMGASGPQYDAC